MRNRRVALYGQPVGVANPEPNLRHFKSQGVGVLERTDRSNPRVYHSLLEFDTYVCKQFEHPEARAHTQMLLDPPDELIDIAREVGVREPRLSKRVPSLSTDLVFETQQGILPVACKYRQELETEPRQGELLEITRRFWERRGCTQQLVTEEDLERMRCQNLRQAHHAAVAMSRWDKSLQVHAFQELLMAIGAAGGATVCELTSRLDAKLPPPVGRAATSFWAAIWHHWLPADVSIRILPATLVCTVLSGR